MIKYPETIRVYDDFLPPDVAQQLYSKVSGIPQQWFSVRKTKTDNHLEEPEYSKTWWSIHGAKDIPSTLDQRGRMTYQFLATDNHQDSCECAYCDMNRIFASQPPPDVGDDYMSEAMLTVYRPGDFLSQHHDKRDTRTWAFTYTLSPGWRPEFGGVLNIQDPEDGNWYSFPPKFNRLILLNVGETSMNHFVSAVIPESPINRVTYSGWFSARDSVQEAA
jgi:Rps23 Pro-64 3,4-dihydroxylase Tpa1-like proline 4-hydroxylase